MSVFLVYITIHINLLHVTVTQCTVDLKIMDTTNNKQQLTDKMH